MAFKTVHFQSTQWLVSTEHAMSAYSACIGGQQGKTNPTLQLPAKPLTIMEVLSIKAVR